MLLHINNNTARLVKNFPEQNFFDNTFSFVNFKEESVNITNDNNNEKEKVGMYNSYDNNKDCLGKVDNSIVHFVEKYLIIKNILNNCINEYLNEYYNFISIMMYKYSQFYNYQLKSKLYVI